MWSRLACPIALYAATIYAQGTSGSISGVIVDPSDAVVPNALVSFANSTKLETRADSSGAFVLPSLEPGVYHLKLESPGFKVKELDVSVEAGKETTLGRVLMDLAPVARCIGPDHKSQTSLKKLPFGGAPRILVEARGADGHVSKYLTATLSAAAGIKPVGVSNLNEKGEIQFLDVSPGIYDLEISQGDTSLIQIKSLRVPPGYEVKIRVRWAQPQICL